MIIRKLISITTTLIIALLLVSLYSCKEKKKPISDAKYDSRQVDQYFKLADKFYDDIKYDSAFYYANKVRLLINPKKDLKKYTTTMFILIASQQLRGDYSGAESSIVEALYNIEKTKSETQKYKFHNILAYNFTNLRNYDEALYYYKKASTFNIDKKRKILSKLNVGHIYKEKKQFKKAVEILLPLLQEKEIQKNKYYKSGVLNDLGYCYFKIGKPNAIVYLNKSLELNSNLDSTADNDYDLTANYYYLYEYYSVHNKNKALNYAKLLYQKATEYNNPDDRMLALSLLVKNTEGNESKKYALKYVVINDSITEVRQKSKNYFAKLKYDSKKEKEENLKLKAEKELKKELERNKNRVITFTIIIILIISGFFSYYLIERNKKEKLETAYNTETRIAKKLHDELANDIYQTMAFAETHDLSTSDNTEKLLDNLDSIYLITRNLSRENSQIETGKLFGDGLGEMISGFNNSSLNLIINGLEEIDWTTIANFKKISIYRVIQELLVNMKKHSESNLVILSFKKKENNLLINYFDNGIGIDFDKIKTKNGLQNIEDRITAINGNINFDSKPNKGIKINMIIPV